VVNRILAKDMDVGHLIPIDPDNEDIFEKVGDGIIFCKIINAIQEGTIDKRCINVIKNGKKPNIY